MLMVQEQPVRENTHRQIQRQSKRAGATSCCDGPCGASYRQLSFVIPLVAVTSMYVVNDNGCCEASSLVAGCLAGLSSYTLYRFVKMLRHERVRAITPTSNRRY
jgi:hypothetical protein